VAARSGRRAQAHAVQAGEHITNLAGHPSLKIGPLLETHKHNVDEILREALTHEQEGLAEYRTLLAAVADRNVMLEDTRARRLPPRRPTSPTSARCCASPVPSADLGPLSKG